MTLLCRNDLKMTPVKLQNLNGTWMVSLRLSCLHNLIKDSDGIKLRISTWFNQGRLKCQHKCEITVGF